MFLANINVSKSTLDLCMLYEGINRCVKTRKMKASGDYHERLAIDLHDRGL